MFGSMVGFSGTADLMALFMRKTSELDFVWESSLRYVGYTVSRQEIKLQLLTGTICE